MLAEVGQQAIKKVYTCLLQRDNEVAIWRAFLRADGTLLGWFDALVLRANEGRVHIVTRRRSAGRIRVGLWVTSVVVQGVWVCLSCSDRSLQFRQGPRLHSQSAHIVKQVSAKVCSIGVLLSCRQMYHVSFHKASRQKRPREAFILHASVKLNPVICSIFQRDGAL